MSAMRNRITLSLSKSLLEEIDKIVANDGFSSKSDFIRHLIYNYSQLGSKDAQEERPIFKAPGIGLPISDIKELERLVRNEN